MHAGRRRQSKKPEKTVAPPAQPISDNLTLKIIRIQERYKLGRLLVRSVALVTALYVGLALPVKWAAGQETSVGILYGVQLLANAAVEAKAEVIIPWALVGALFLLWMRERLTGMRALHREHRRLAHYEQQLDPHRTSSELKEVREAKALPASTQSEDRLDALREELRSGLADLKTSIDQIAGQER